MKKDQVVRFEDAKCVWKLDCPYCGWLFGFCLDLTGWHLAEGAIFLVNRRRRIPTRFPKRESGHTFAYFKVRGRKCKRCRAIIIAEDNLSDWLVSRDIEPMDYDEIETLLLGADPDGLLAVMCSDRVYDSQFEEWGVNGMPSRYVAVRGSSEAQRKLAALLRSRA